MAVGRILVKKCFSGQVPVNFLKHLWCRQNVFLSMQASYWTASCQRLIQEQVLNDSRKSLLKHTDTQRCFSYYCLQSDSKSRDPLLAQLDKNVSTSSTCQHRKETHSLAKDAQLTLPIYLYSEKYLANTALVDTHGSLTYADVLHHSMSLAVEILQMYDAVKEMKLNGERIALLADRNAAYTVGLFATWICNGVCVPLCELHPATEWEYFLKDAQCSLILVTDTLFDKIAPVAESVGVKVKVISRQSLGKYEKNRWFQADHASNPRQVRRVFEQRKQRWFDRAEESVLKKPAFILYTSGTTGKPKGVVLTHGNMAATVSGLIRSWGWTSNDVILHVLPLHHLHGIANVLLTSLACGATCVMEQKFDAQRVWHLLTSPVIDHFDRGINLFMAVPTIYAKLLQYFDEHIAKTKASTTAAEFIRHSTSTKIRLMVSGSSALPQPVRERWMELTGHNLLERYGMTETGMILSNPLHGPRIPESVGTPLPNIEVRITKPNVYSANGYDTIAEGNCRHTVVTGEKDEHGELLVRGPSVFKEYWNKPEATAETFTKDGWFKTGDTVKFSNGAYFIVGRTSVDVIKSGGYKISALHIENKLLAHPDILDCAVVGVADITWGQKVAAVVTLQPDKVLGLQELREWLKDYLPPYEIPTVVKFVDAIPRNVLGKVNKKEITNHFFSESANKK